MDWHEEILELLAANPRCGYGRESASTEPTALAALALLGAGHDHAAQLATEWLKDLQAGDGSVGVRQDEPAPGWPTSLAVLAWLTADKRAADSARYEGQIERGIAWMLAAKGTTRSRTKAAGHDPSLVAWPWVEGTHSWIEPTALHVVALKAAGYGPHPRVREATRLLIDRQIPGGGCNYGNTFILGQKLRPHLQPTGLALLALAGEPDPDGRIQQSLNYLRRHTCAETPPVSLSWSLLGLAAHRQRPRDADGWLARSYGSAKHQGRSLLKFALLSLAYQATDSPLFQAVGTPDRQAAVSG